KALILAFILSRCARRGKQSVHYRVYLVAVRSPWQAKCALSRLSCRGALAVASKARIFKFILSRYARRGTQSVYFLVYLVAVRLPALAAITRASISRLSCRSALVVCLLASHFLVYLLTHAHPECRLSPHDDSFLSILFQDVTGFYHN